MFILLYIVNIFIKINSILFFNNFVILVINKYKK